ncbi:MAG: hypothetical protein SVR04_01365 [Spirochaetota bacterium]|nr:hypothetical protein [Spirochaetota bacterium]
MYNEIPLDLQIFYQVEYSDRQPHGRPLPSPPTALPIGLIELQKEPAARYTIRFPADRANRR